MQPPMPSRYDEVVCRCIFCVLIVQLNGPLFFRDMPESRSPIRVQPSVISSTVIPSTTKFIACDKFAGSGSRSAPYHTALLACSLLIETHCFFVTHKGTSVMCTTTATLIFFSAHRSTTVSSEGTATISFALLPYFWDIYIMFSIKLICVLFSLATSMIFIKDLNSLSGALVMDWIMIFYDNKRFWNKWPVYFFSKKTLCFSCHTCAKHGSPVLNMDTSL